MQTDKAHGLSFPMVMFATIFFSTVLRLTNFLSLDSAACSSARNSYRDRRGVSAGRACGGDGGGDAAHLYLAALKEFGILPGLGRHGGCTGSRRGVRPRK